MNEIYVIKTGEENYFWPRAREGNFTSLMFDQPFFDAWAANDREAFLAVTAQYAKKGATESAKKAEATSWFNYGEKIRDTVGDIFILRDEHDVYWARSTEGEAFYLPHQYGGTNVVAICKPVDSWSRFTAKNVPLKWSTIHRKAHAYLSPYQALFRIADNEMREYLNAMLHGGDLSTWHNLPNWIEKQGGDLGSSKSLNEMAVAQLMHSINHTVAYSNGQVIQTEVKNKNIDGSEEELRQYLFELIDKQNGRCALTGITMHVLGQEGLNRDLLVSPDRIDSSLNYAKNNIQIVCQFVNFWKSSMKQEKFLALLDLVVATKSGELKVSGSGKI